MEAEKAYRKIIILSFPPEKSNRPVVCNLTRLFDLTFNILKAQVTPRKQGYMTLELSGSKENYDKGVAYLKENGISITRAEEKIYRDEQSCVHCGMCTAMCPCDALFLEAEDRTVIFDTDRCTACGLCVRVCPVRAMHVEVENENW